MIIVSGCIHGGLRLAGISFGQMNASGVRRTSKKGAGTLSFSPMGIGNGLSGGVISVLKSHGKGEVVE